MSTTKSKRATIYFDPALHKAVRLKAAETDQSISDVVDEAVRFLLIEDAGALADDPRPPGCMKLTGGDASRVLFRLGRWGRSPNGLCFTRKS